MANPTMILIASNTVGSGGVSSVTFSSIPATYTDLVVKVSARDTRSVSLDGNNYNISFNGVSTNQTQRALYGAPASSSSALTYADTTIYVKGDDTAVQTANTFGSSEIYIHNYANSINKSMIIDGVTENNALDAAESLVAGYWASTAAITSITLTPANTVNFVQYSTFYLYGIKNA